MYCFYGLDFRDDHRSFPCQFICSSKRQWKDYVGPRKHAENTEIDEGLKVFSLVINENDSLFCFKPNKYKKDERAL